MRHTKIVIGLLVIVCNLSRASTDPECLKHLGGAFGDVECFNGLSNVLKQENTKLAHGIDASIPNKNKNKELLKRYLQVQAQSKDFCELNRQSMNGWEAEKTTINPRYRDYDVAYYECVYLLLEQENKFLKNLHKNIY